MNKLRRLFDVDESRWNTVTMSQLMMLAQTHEIYLLKTIHDTYFCYGKWREDTPIWVIENAYQFQNGYIDEIHINPKYIVSWYKLGPGVN